MTYQELIDFILINQACIDSLLHSVSTRLPWVERTFKIAQKIKNNPCVPVELRQTWEFLSDQQKVSCQRSFDCYYADKKYGTVQEYASASAIDAILEGMFASECIRECGCGKFWSTKLSLRHC